MKLVKCLNHSDKAKNMQCFALFTDAQVGKMILLYGKTKPIETIDINDKQAEFFIKVSNENSKLEDLNFDVPVIIL